MNKVEKILIDYVSKHGKIPFKVVTKEGKLSFELEQEFLDDCLKEVSIEEIDKDLLTFHLLNRLDIIEKDLL
jgi:hypothetical protein